MAGKNKYSGTKTEQNLLAAFAGESQARNYTPTLHQRQKKKAMNKSQICF